MEAVNLISKYLWGIPVLILMLGGGIYLTVKLHFPQIHIVKIFKITISQMRKSDKGKCDNKDSLSGFQSFSTALAAAVGTGSVTGVGECIRIGGAGAVFWMWVSAFLGMGLSYAENFLAAKYSNGKNCGAFSYLEHIGKTKLTAVVYAVFSVLASLGMGNMAQSGAAVAAAQSGFGLKPYQVVLILLPIAAIVCIGKKSSAGLCEKLVPLMSVIFVGMSLYVIFSCPCKSVSAFKTIFVSAFNPKAVSVGSIGGGIIMCAQEGLKRGAFSNEAGLGSSCAVNSACGTKNPQIQGIWGMAEVFIDTMIICTLTAIVILVSGVDVSLGSSAVAAYSSVLGIAGKYLLSCSLVLFSVAALAGWFFIGEKSWSYIFKGKSLIYRMLSLFAVCVGGLESMELVLGVSDIFNGLMAIPNIIGVLVLSKQIKIILPKSHHLHGELHDSQR